MTRGELEKDSRSESDMWFSQLWAKNANLLGRCLGWCSVKALRAFEMSVRIY
jgi:hypothetical protein